MLFRRRSIFDHRTLHRQSRDVVVWHRSLVYVAVGHLDLPGGRLRQLRPVITVQVEIAKVAFLARKCQSRAGQDFCKPGLAAGPARDTLHFPVSELFPKRTSTSHPIDSICLQADPPIENVPVVDTVPLVPFGDSIRRDLPFVIDRVQHIFAAGPIEKPPTQPGGRLRGTDLVF